MASRTFKGDALSFGALAKDLQGAGLDRVNKEIGAAAERIVRQVASNDLGGDPKFSGWAPKLEVQTKPLRGKVPGVVIFPTRTGAGPLTVAERGRNQGETGDVLGPGVNRNTGMTARTKSGKVRKVRAFQAKRWNGTTKGKGTATSAVAEFNRQLVPIVEKGVVLLTRKHLGG